MMLPTENRIRHAAASMLSPRAIGVVASSIRPAATTPPATRTTTTTATVKQASVPRKAVSRAVRGSSLGSVVGYAILWDKLSLDLGGFRERIVRAALDDTMKGIEDGTLDILFQYAHNGEHLLGRTSSGHLTLTRDASGLRYHARLPDTALARDLQRLIAEGILKGASIGFTLGIDSWDRSGPMSLRTIKRLSLWEISVVSRPAYYMTSAQVTRSAPTSTTWQTAKLRAVAAKPHRRVASDMLRADDRGMLRR